jgi:hypothetical protein
MTRNGKIARLPLAVREELNRRLENGEPGVRLIEWLNGLPEVNAVLKEYFEGQPISDANLTQWKNGGFLDWQARVKTESMVERWPIDCGLRIADWGLRRRSIHLRPTTARQAVRGRDMWRRR